jgi:hypothetical protein
MEYFTAIPNHAEKMGFAVYLTLFSASGYAVSSGKMNSVGRDIKKSGCAPLF